MAGNNTQGLPAVAPSSTGGITAIPSGTGKVSLDTYSTAGAAPQTVGPTAFQLASCALTGIYNSGTLSSNTATLNTRSGVILTGSISTAVGSTYAFAIVNSLATTGTPFQLNLMAISDTTPGAFLNSATIATSGTISATIGNAGTAALNGTFLVPFHVG